MLIDHACEILEKYNALPFDKKTKKKLFSISSKYFRDNKKKGVIISVGTIVFRGVGSFEIYIKKNGVLAVNSRSLFLFNTRFSCLN